MTESYLRLTEESNALDYLEKATGYIKTSESNLTDWKWVILGLHGALYGFMICTLKGTNPDNVLVFTKKREPRLIDFGEALRRCQDSACMNMTVNSKVLQLSAEQERALKFIHETFRNNFEHYQPRLWSIELHGMPKIAMDALDVIRFLALETGNYMHLNAGDRANIEALITGAKECLQASQLFVEAES